MNEEPKYFLLLIENDNKPSYPLKNDWYGFFATLEEAIERKNYFVTEGNVKCWEVVDLRDWIYEKEGA